jgi:hypothetical protein
MNEQFLISELGKISQNLVVRKAHTTQINALKLEIQRMMELFIPFLTMRSNLTKW